MSRFAFTALVLGTLLWVGCGKKTKTQKSSDNGKTASKTESKSKSVAKSKTESISKTESKSKPEVVKKKPKTKPLKEKVIGKWKSAVEVDDAKVTQFLKGMGTPEADIPAASKKVKQLFSAMVVVAEMRADGTYTVTISGAGPKPKVENGKWELISEEGSVLKVKVTEDKPDAKPETLTLTFRSDDELGYVTDSPAFKQVPIKTPVKYNRVKE